MTNATVKAQHLGVDAGGTQISVLADTDPLVVVLPLHTFGSLQDAVRHTVEQFGVPETMVIGAAGPVQTDGSIDLTNRPDWPTFNPMEVGAALGCTITVVNDMVIKAAGMLDAQVETLHPGREAADGSRAVVTVSTGVGNAQLRPDGTVVSSEGGHTTWQPADGLEDELLWALRHRHGTRYFSIEDLIGGGHLFKLYDALGASGYRLEPVGTRLRIENRRFTGAGIGPVLTELALKGDRFGELFMTVVGSLLGQYLRNLAVFALPTGGIYLTGGVMKLSVAQYLYEKTSLREAFLGGATHNNWLADIPLYLIVDPNLGVKGALSLAKQN